MALADKRMTFIVDDETRRMLDDAKRTYFYNNTRSEMIRELIRAGIRAQRVERDGEIGTEYYSTFDD